MTTGLQPLETVIYESAMSIVGDPTYLGLLVLGFFFGFVTLQNVRTDVKVLIIVPAFFLALGFVPWFKALIIVVLGVLLFLGLSRWLRF